MTPSAVIFGTIGIVIALAGLLMAATATDQAFYVAGLIMFAGFVLFLFTLIKRHFDAADAARHHDGRG
jgi:Zn-dependent membrane protease YugP